MDTLQLITTDLRERIAELESEADSQLRMSDYGRLAETQGAIAELTRLLGCYENGYTLATEESLR